MKLSVAYLFFALSMGLIFVLALAGCTTQDPTGPDVVISGNTGPLTVNNTSGSSSPIGTAKCGASSTQKVSQIAPGSQDCSDATAPPPEPIIVQPQ
jgi:hypothetical protein